jgi:hypothetical protein
MAETISFTDLEAIRARVAAHDASQADAEALLKEVDRRDSREKEAEDAREYERNHPRGENDGAGGGMG